MLDPKDMHNKNFNQPPPYLRRGTDPTERELELIMHTLGNHEVQIQTLHTLVEDNKKAIEALIGEVTRFKTIFNRLGWGLLAIMMTGNEQAFSLLRSIWGG